jgi:hypothetical protein
MPNRQRTLLANYAQTADIALNDAATIVIETRGLFNYCPFRGTA